MQTSSSIHLRQELHYRQFAKQKLNYFLIRNKIHMFFKVQQFCRVLRSEFHIYISLVQKVMFEPKQLTPIYRDRSIAFGRKREITDRSKNRGESNNTRETSKW